SDLARQNRQAAEHFDEYGDPRHQMRRRDIQGMQDVDECIRSSFELGEAMSHETKTEDQSRWDRGPSRQTRAGCRFGIDAQCSGVLFNHRKTLFQGGPAENPCEQSRGLRPGISSSIAWSG